MSTLRMTSDLRRELILGAAKRCFARHGFAGTTTKRVAAAASISEGLLFKHFPTKSALYAEFLAGGGEGDPGVPRFRGVGPRRKRWSSRFAKWSAISERSRMLPINRKPSVSG